MNFLLMIRRLLIHTFEKIIPFFSNLYSSFRIIQNFILFFKIKFVFIEPTSSKFDNKVNRGSTISRNSRTPYDPSIMLYRGKFIVFNLIEFQKFLYSKKNFIPKRFFPIL